MRKPIGMLPPDTEYMWVSVTGKRFASVPKRGPLVIDGKPDIEVDRVQTGALSDDGKTLAYFAVRGKDTLLVIDGKVRAEVEQASSVEPAIVGGRVLCMALQDGAWWLFVDGKRRYGPFTDEAPGRGFYSSYHTLRPNDDAVTYIAVRGDVMRVEIAGKPASESYELVRAPTFSHDGKRLAFMALRDDKWLVVIDGKEHGAYNDCEKPRFASDGKLWFSAGNDGDYVLCADGVVVERHEYIKRFVLAADAPNRAVLVRNAKARTAIVVDGAQRTEWLNNALGLCMTSDGAHWGAINDRGSKGDVIVDGVVTHKGVASINEASLVLCGATPVFHVNAKQEFVQVGKRATAKFDALWSDLVVTKGRVAFVADKGGEVFVEDVAIT